MAVTWKKIAYEDDVIAKSLLTTRGDIIGASGASTPVRLGVGSDDECLVADSGESSGLNWAERSKVVWKDASATPMSDLNRTATLNWTDLDLTSDTSSKAKIALLRLDLAIDSITAPAIAYLGVRKNGTTPSAFPLVICGSVYGDIAGSQNLFTIYVGMDTDQIIEYTIYISGTIQVDSYISVLGYIE